MGSVLIKHYSSLSYGPGHEKTCLQGLLESKTQTRLLSYLDKLNFPCSKSRYVTSQIANNRLVCAFDIRKPQRQVFLCQGTYDVTSVSDISPCIT